MTVVGTFKVQGVPVLIGDIALMTANGGTCLRGRLSAIAGSNGNPEPCDAAQRCLCESILASRESSALRRVIWRITEIGVRAGKSRATGLG